MRRHIELIKDIQAWDTFVLIGEDGFVMKSSLMKRVALQATLRLGTLNRQAGNFRPNPENAVFNPMPHAFVASKLIGRTRLGLRQQRLRTTNRL